MAFKRKLGDDTDDKLNILRDEIAELRRQQEVMADELVIRRDLVQVVEKMEHIAAIQTRQVAPQPVAFANLIHHCVKALNNDEDNNQRAHRQHSPHCC